jgi:hypothetical protein
MSATGVAKADGTKSKRRDGDFYETPAWCVKKLMEQLEIRNVMGGGILEPCAGRGAIVSVINEELECPRWTCVELNPEYENSIVSVQKYGALYCPQDYLTWEF